MRTYYRVMVIERLGDPPDQVYQGWDHAVAMDVLDDWIKAGAITGSIQVEGREEPVPKTEVPHE